MTAFKNVLAAVLGYVVMFAVAFVLFSLMWWVLGAEGSFEAGTWRVSGAWIAGSLTLGALVAVAGGFACSKLAPSAHGVAFLVVLVVLVGIVSGLSDASGAATARPDGVTMFDAMTGALQPTWLLRVNPVLGVIGVLVGARLESRRPV